MRHWGTGSALVAAVVLLGGCTGSGEPAGGTSAAASTAPAVESASPVAFTDCAERCEGEIDGAKYRILLPDEWNGTLLLYSHGYRNPDGVGGRAGDSRAEPSPAYNDGGVPLAGALLDQGYALAGSGWSSNGWAVEDGVRANSGLYEFFRRTVGEPERVYAWGDSLGGLVTMETAEANPDWVTGAAPLCGVVGGVVPNMDLALDLAYAVRELIDPDLEIVGYASAEDAANQLVRSAQRVGEAAASPKARADVLALALLVDAALQTQSQDGTTLDSQIQAAAEAAVTGLRFTTVARLEIEQRFGGNISDNTTTDYGARLSDEDRAMLDEVGGAGTADRIVKTLARGERVSASPEAVRAARTRGGEPSGEIAVPTITLHTAADPLVAVQNQTLLREASGLTQDLVQLFTVAPDAYAPIPGAAYGAGHCNFTPESRIGMVTLLDRWVRQGLPPTQEAVSGALGANSGYQPSFQPGPWPTEDGQ